MILTLEKHDIESTSFYSDLENHTCVVRQLFPHKKLKKKAIHIIFMHGALEYGKRHIPLFDYLRDYYKNEVLISYCDLVGHGESSGSRGYIDHFNTYQNDYLKFLRSILHVYHEYELTTFLMGHSLGGMITLSAISENKMKLPFQVDGVILSNPCIKAKFELPDFFIGIVKSFSKHLSKIRVSNLYDGHDLTRDKHRAIDFNGDPLILKFVTVALALSINDYSKKIFNESYYIDIPTYFQLSTDDEIVDIEATFNFIKGMEKDLVKISKYENAKHDLYNEIQRNEVFNDIIKYINEVRK